VGRWARVDPRFAGVPRHLDQVLIRSDAIRVELRNVDANGARREVPGSLTVVAYREGR
jgi:hypothetical protein